MLTHYNPQKLIALFRLFKGTIADKAELRLGEDYS